MKVRRFYVATALTAAGLLLNGSAQSADAPAPKWYETTKISGFADAYYKFNGDGRKSATANTAEGVFDKHQNEFSVGGGKVEMSSMDGNAVVDLYFGDYAAALQGVAPAKIGRAHV